MVVCVRCVYYIVLLEGNYTFDTQFGPNDHRKHRPRAWLENGIKKVDQLGFLTSENNRTLGQVALKYVMRSPQVVSAFPNIYNFDQLNEFATAADVPDISEDHANKIEQLFESNYGLERVREAGLSTR